MLYMRVLFYNIRTSFVLKQTARYEVIIILFYPRKDYSTGHYGQRIPHEYFVIIQRDILIYVR